MGVSEGEGWERPETGERWVKVGEIRMGVGVGRGKEERKGEGWMKFGEDGCD